MQQYESQRDVNLQLSQYLANYVVVIEEFIENEILEKGKHLFGADKFYYTIIKKTQNLLNAVGSLIQNLEKEIGYTDAIYILLRPSLLDVASLYFVLDKSSENELHQSRIDRIMFDHVNSIHQCADSIEEKFAIREKFPSCFNGEQFKKELKIRGIWMMFREIGLPNLKTEVRNLIEIYNRLSKVEHTGLMTANFMNEYLTETGKQESWKLIVKSILNIMLGINNTIAIRYIIIGDEGVDIRNDKYFRVLLKIFKSVEGLIMEAKSSNDNNEKE